SPRRAFFVQVVRDAFAVAAVVLHWNVSTRRVGRHVANFRSKQRIPLTYVTKVAIPIFLEGGNRFFRVWVRNVTHTRSFNWLLGGVAQVVCPVEPTYQRYDLEIMRLDDGYHLFGQAFPILPRHRS